jgi:hypothetical protein
VYGRRIDPRRERPRFYTNAAARWPESSAGGTSATYPDPHATAQHTRKNTNKIASPTSVEQRPIGMPPVRGQAPR